jgi:uncharacterized membrane protein YfcA
MDWSATDIVIIAALSLVGGTLGGLLGLGGSVFIIPALTLSFGANQHLYQAAALIANLFVAVAATLRHRGRGTIRGEITPALATAAGVAAIVGVLVSNMIPARPLMAIFGVFLCVSSSAEIIGLLLKKSGNEDPAAVRCGSPLATAVGTAGGLASGLLGIGGGLIIVPLLRRLGKVPMRQAAATSAVAIIAACAVGAVAKNLSIPSLTDGHGNPLTIKASLILALLITPTATLGGVLGATLVYRVPIRALRAIFAILLAFAGVRMVLSGIGAS